MIQLIKLAITLTAISLFCLGCSDINFDEPWRFINAPDLHNSEVFVNVWEQAWDKEFESYEAFRDNKLKERIAQFKHIHDKHDAELFVSPGDCNTARWDSRWGTSFRKKFRSLPQYVQLSDEDVILKASDLCYSALNEIIYSSGYHEFLMAVGDHELGDNPWRQDSEAAVSIPIFRQGFANHFTLKKPFGKSRFNKPIGKIPPRPIGTIYENTSNAVRYKNILFITLDVFRYDGNNTVLGDEGLICGDIAGKHLEWLENILSEAQNIPSIDHIIVQAHLPIIYPVRKHSSSGMMMSGTSDNVLMKTMRKFNVDMYLTGEVHMNTVTKDPESDLVQFVSNGINLINYSVVEVTKYKLMVKTYNQDDTIIGTLTIDKSGKHKTIEGSGALYPINPEGLQIHWSFDSKTDRKNFSGSIGGFPKPGRNTPIAGFSGEPFSFINDGEFGNGYSLFGEHIDLTDGITGKAIYLNESSALFVVAIGPLYLDLQRTITCWVKTTNAGRKLIFNASSIWRPTAQFFNISLNEGNLELSLRPEITATAKNSNLNDGNWHHIAVVIHPNNVRLADCQMYVDGRLVEEISYRNGESVINTAQANWITIATLKDQSKPNLQKTMSMSQYTGYLDDFGIWTRALNAGEIRRLFENGKMGIDAMQTEAVLNKKP